MPQNSLQSGAAHIDLGVAHIDKNAKSLPLRDISIRDFLQVGLLIYTTFFSAPKVNFKEYFHSRLASIQVAKEGEQSPKPFVIFVMLHL